MKHLTLPLTPEAIASLHAGDEVLLTGWLYTGRDAAHKRLAACLSAGEPTPFPLEGETIYYVGPAPARPGQVIGSVGTTSLIESSSAPHLHFSVTKDGKAIDPNEFLK